MGKEKRGTHRLRNRKHRVGINVLVADTKRDGCVLCGYNKCLSALEFHHIDRNKEFGVSYSRESIPRIKNEISKCVVVCANCHREIHAGQNERFVNIETRVVEKLPLLEIIEGGG